MLIKKIKWPGLKWFLIVPLSVFVLTILLFASIYLGIWGQLPSSGELRILKQDRATQILSSEEKLIGKFYIYDRQPVSYRDFPQHLIDALIATEDVRFYEHEGIDNKSLLRVFFKSILLRNDSSGGGSTITLQLAKNIYGRKKYGASGIIINKVQEAIIAKRLEDIYTKKEILRLYLNTVPFSDNTFGIESASAKFFDKHTSELDLTEAALLVGMLKATYSYNPRVFPEKSKARRNVVLVQMAKYGFISDEEAALAKESELILDYKNYSHDKGLAPYFREQVRKNVSKILDTLKNKDGQKYNIYRDGLVVHTTLNYKMQLLAEEAMTEHMTVLQEQHEKSYGNAAPWITNKQILKDAISSSNSYKNLQEEGFSETEITNILEKKKPTKLFEYNGSVNKEVNVKDSIAHYLKFLNSGFLAVAPSTGAVKAWIGGVDFRYFQYDHVSQSKRQVGSTFKPVVYTTALEEGIEPCSYFSVEEVTYQEGWTPSNSSDEENPYMNYNMKEAHSKSMNTIAVKVLMEAGIEKVLSQAKKMGIDSPLPNVPSIALGTASMSILELTKAYTGFVNKTRPVTPYYITKIEDGEGNILAEFEPEISTKPAFSETTRQVMIEIMKATVNEGTASRLRYSYELKNDIAGKTGTTQNNKDGWFVGITPNLLTVTWVGADDHRIGFRNTTIGQGANSALPVFARLMQKMNLDKDFHEITSARFAPVSTEVASLMDCDPEKRDGFFTRLFSDPDKKKKPIEKKEKKRGFFKRLFGKKDKN